MPAFSPTRNSPHRRPRSSTHDGNNPRAGVDWNLAGFAVRSQNVSVPDDGEPFEAIRVLPPEDGPTSPELISRSRERGLERFVWPAVVGVALLTLWLAVSGTWSADQPRQTAPIAADEPPPSSPPPGNDPAVAVQEVVAPVQSSAAVWTVARIDGVDAVAGVDVDSGRMAAVVDTPDGPAVITSASGNTWRVEDRLAPPPDVRLRELVEHAGRLVAFGVIGGELAAWSSPTSASWQAADNVDLVGLSGSLVAASNGDQLLLIAESAADGPRVRVSEDAIDWQAGPAPLPVDQLTLINTATGHEGWFYVGGSRCVADRCLPAIVRSRDGATWESIQSDNVEGIDHREGTVTHLAATRDGLVVFGRVTTDDTERVVVWLSKDGERLRAAPEAPALAPASLRVRVSRIESASIRVSVATTVHDLAVGESLETVHGALRLVTIDDGVAYLDAPGGSTHAVQAGGLVPLAAELEVMAVDAEGRRVVAAGLDRTGSEQLAVAWTSVDGGLSWERIDLPAGSGAAAEHVIVDGGDVAILGATDRGVVGWRGQWRTDTIAFAAEQAVHDLVTAVRAADTGELVSLLAAADDSPVQNLPGVAVADLSDHWWDDATASIDAGSVAATLDYLRAIESVVSLGSCRTAVTLADVDGAAVTCGYTTASTLLRGFGLDGVDGTIRVEFQDGDIQRITVTEERSAAMWQALTDWTADARPDRLTTLTEVTAADTRLLAPTLDATTAPIHLALVDEMASSLLLPGDIAVADSPLGRIEWTWIEEPFGSGASSAGVVRGPDALYAVTFDSRGPSPRLWRSTDAYAWTEMQAPEADWFGQPHVFGDTLLLNGEHRDVPRIWALEEDGWAEIEIDRVDGAAAGGGLQIVAVAGDRALVRITSWDAFGELTDERLGLVSADLTYQEVTLPAGMYANEDAYLDFTTAVTDDGITVITHRFGDSPSVWRTSNFVDWTKLGDIPELSEAGFAWFVHHGGRYVAVVWRQGETCWETPHGTTCANPLEIWTSPTGAEFAKAGDIERVSAFTASFGPHGAVAVGGNPGDGGAQIRPGNVMFSDDGITWVTAAAPLLLDPAASWSWVGNVTYSDDRIVIGIDIDRSPPGGSAFRPGATLLVGRFVDN